ncbi:MAG: glycosyltransferase family 39 protein [Nitrososphaerota archaeon]|nr:glycosyltransferase family 39 protein [Candidatus Bathyarchaeota archaeon]MDW8023959.1 glycosyltransferase family 39 protein [Nitrososphaerota archaeon]
MIIDKRDIATVIILSITFFVIAVWNLGMTSVPTSTWAPSEGESFYIDFGSSKNISAVYFLLKDGEIDVRVYTGSPGNWSGGRTVSLRDYYCWRKVELNCETRFVRFVFGPSSGEIAEIAALSVAGEKIVIDVIRSEKGNGEKLVNLIDEQEKVECPPTYMSETYFDEIYYVRAAEDYINLREPYEWTHPPLGKLIITASIIIFGYNPFGWRIMGVVFATLMIPVIYVFGKKLFRTWVGAFASTFLLMFDFMHFTMGRIATVDTYVVFFSLTSHLFFFIYFQNVLKSGWRTSTLPLFLAVLFFALGFSTKWYTFYGFIGQVLILLMLRVRDIAAAKEGWAARIETLYSRPFARFMVFLAIAAAIYLLTYFPHLLMGRTLKYVYDLQLSMYVYHSTLTATHPFSSPWWSWPLLVSRWHYVPVWFYISYLPNDMVSTIVAMGNPAVWWVGFASIICLIEETIKRRDHACGFVLAIFFFQWLPYAFISRCLFLYHFYFNVPLIILATAYFLNKAWGSKWGKTFWISYLVVVVALFVLFYPVISGSPTPGWWRDRLRWFNWWF